MNISCTLGKLYSLGAPKTQERRIKTSFSGNHREWGGISISPPHDTMPADHIIEHCLKIAQDRMRSRRTRSKPVHCISRAFRNTVKTFCVIVMYTNYVWKKDFLKFTQLDTQYYKWCWLHIKWIWDKIIPRNKRHFWGGYGRFSGWAQGPT